MRGIGLIHEGPRKCFARDFEEGSREWTRMGCGLDRPAEPDDETDNAKAQAWTVAVRDGYPVSEGHTLVMPRRHVVSLFDGSAEEQAALWEMVAVVWQELQDIVQPHGFNIGVNEGAAAGQIRGRYGRRSIPAGAGSPGGARDLDRL